MKIRAFQSSDYISIQKLLVESNMFDETWDSQPNLESLVSKDPQAILVAQENDQIIACIYIIPFGTHVSFAFRLVVKENYRQQGVATKLLNQAEAICQSKGALELGLFVDANNHELSQFYLNRHFNTSNKPWLYMWKKIS